MKKNFIPSVVFILFFCGAVFSQAPYRVASQYEDSVRVAIIWNNATGNECTNAALHTPVGQKTRDFVVKSLDTNRVHNTRVLINTTSQQVTWAQIQALWGATRLPHVIVHVNAGWSSGWNTATLQNTFAQAVANHIGIVSVGDDAANLATQTFGFTNVDNVPPPLGDGTSIDSLWVGLIRANDNRLKVYDATSKLEYPYVNGIISNAIDSILKSRSIVQFKPRNNGRCQADADRYATLYPQWLTMLGYQQGYLNSRVQPDRSNDLNVLVAIQDTTPTTLVIRRGVSVSFQPQFLKDSIAVGQIVYDAIMFASLAHTLSVPTTLIIRTEDDTITAGQIDSLKAYIIDQNGDTIVDPTVTVNIRWSILNPVPGDRIIGNDFGSKIQYTATQAYRSIRIRATHTGSNRTISDTAVIYVKPGPAAYLIVENSSTPPNFGNNPVGGNGTMTIPSAQTTARGYAVLRDQYTNYVSFSTRTKWDTLSPTGLITAASGNRSIGEGVVTKLGNSGTTYVRATDTLLSFRDTATVIIENTTYDSLRILRYDVAQGRLVIIPNLSIRTSDTVTLYVQGLRTDRVGPPGSGGWVDVAGNWAMSASLHTNPNPPSTQNNWRFTPADTGHGTITVTVSGSTATKTISAEFLSGSPIRLVLYKSGGDPALSTMHAEPPLVSDTLIAGKTYNKLYVKLFDDRSTWLQDYETNYTKSQQISWTFTPVNETSLGSLSGYSNTLTSRVAYRSVKVKATLNALSDSALIYVKNDTAHHLVIEATATIRNYIDDDPLSRLVIASDQTFRYAYAILRDAYGNFVDYSKATVWFSLDTAVFKADTGMKALGEGMAIRNSSQGLSKVIATDTLKKMRDTAEVEVQSISYTALRLYYLDNGPKYADSITINSDGQTTLYVEGMRSDNNSWELVTANWSKDLAVKTLSILPTTMASEWTVIPNPDSLGSGWIKVNRGSAADSIWARFIPGKPAKVVIYKEAGNPKAQIPYQYPPQTNSVNAGMTMPFYAKVFDSKDNWLAYYENNNVSLGILSWSISKVSGAVAAESLSTRAGHVTSFTPTAAHMTYQLSAQLKIGNELPITSQISITVVPDTANHLVIEGTPNITGAALNKDQPLIQIEFSAKDTIRTGYAILRDRFGNLAQPPYSTSTLWTSFDTLIVKAREGTAAVGEGLVTRTGTIGQTKVVATSKLNARFKDTIDVILKNFSYDSLRIVVDDTTRIKTLVMRSDQDTIIKVQGKLSHNNTWVAVEGNWVYTAGSVSLSQSNASLWNFNPGDTGTGKIIVSLGTAVPDTITVTILPGLPAKLVLYPKEGPVPDFNNIPYANPSDTLIDTAGTPFPVVAKIFDHRGVWLSNYELTQSNSQLIKWTIQEMPGFSATGKLNDTAGHKVSFTGIKAYQSVFAIARFTVNAVTYKDTVLIKVVPGKPYQVVIEGSPDWKSSPNKINPIDTVEITDSTTHASVYAIVRDSLGNFCSYALVTQWAVVNNDTIITIDKANVNLGEGRISRKASQGITRISVLESNNFRDTAFVQLLPYHYTQLRIIANKVHIQSLEMNTNQDTTLRVQGLRSDTAVWEDVAAKWEVSSLLKTAPPAPGKSVTWTFSPTDTGNGTIRVTLGIDSITKPDTITAKFTVGPPTRVEIEIVTPPDKLIAGEPIITVIKIFNEDGPVPGTYCFTAKDVRYTDVVGKGSTAKPEPFVLINGKDTLKLNSNWADLAKTQCFTNSVDTVTTILYNVVTDSSHQITVDLGGLKGTTTPFVLHPGHLSAIVLERGGKPIGDTLKLTYLDENIEVIAMGYDKFGNRIKDAVTSNWTIDTLLPPINRPNNVTRIYYSATSAVNNASGILKATSVTNPLINGNVVVTVTAPMVSIKNALTRDLNGNGLLDAIDVTFSKAVSIPKDFLFDNMFIRKDDGTVFVIDSIISPTGKTTDSVWRFSFKEIKPEQPQTNWLPIITFDQSNSLQIAAATNVVVKDGAGPVIFSVTKEIKDLDDRSKDVVTIKFSEPIVRTADGQSLSISDTTSKIFYVWEIDSKGNYVKIDSLLTGINNLRGISSDGTQITFTTSNGADLSSKHFISFNDSIPRIKDTSSVVNGNIPVKGNVKINVLIINNLPVMIRSVPNPSQPIFNRVQPGKLIVAHEPNALRWVRNDNAGTVMAFQIALPDRTETDVHLRCKIKIHDLVGNMVAIEESEDIMKTIPNAALLSYSTKYDVNIYWNGSNKKGMAVAPGVYRVNIALEYYGESVTKNPSKFTNSSVAGTIGIGR